MGGISLFGAKGKQPTKFEPKPLLKPIQKTEQDELENIKKEMIEFLKNKENTFSQQKKELVELIETTIKNKEQCLSETITSKFIEKEKLYDSIIEKSIKQNIEKQKESIQGVCEKNTEKKQQEKPQSEKPKKEQKNRYYQCTETLYSTLVENFPDASAMDKSQVYLGSNDNLYYHKKGNKYNLIDQAYLCKCNTPSK